MICAIAAKKQPTRSFVGRDAELALMDQSFASAPPAVPIFLVHGPGGVGKCCLLERARAQAADRGIDSLRIDARTVEPTAAGLARALGRALGACEGDAGLQRVMEASGSSPLQRLLVIDSARLLPPRLARLPAAALVRNQRRPFTRARAGDGRPTRVAAAARLARPEFERAVRDAMRVLHERAALANNPLTVSSIVAANRRDAESAAAPTSSYDSVTRARTIEHLSAQSHTADGSSDGRCSRK